MGPVLLLLLLAACSEKEKAVTELPVTPAKQEKMTEPDSEWTLNGLSQALSEKKISSSQGRVLENLMAVGEDSAYYCNLQENMRGNNGGDAKDYRVLLCKDPVYDITYYVNYGRDYYIYALRGETSELAVQIPASELYCRKGELYFMAEAYGLYELDPLVEGSVLKYNPTNGNIEVVIETPVYDMTVYPDGIFYRVLTPNEEGTGGIRDDYFYSFSEEKTKDYSLPMRSIERFRNYHFIAETTEKKDGTMEDGYHLETLEGTVGWKLDNITSLPFSYWIKDNSLYYIDTKKDILREYQLETGVDRAVLEIALPMIFPNAFIVHQDEIYFENGILYVPEKNTQYKVEFPNQNSVVSAFYSDGENLYGIVDEQLWRITKTKVSESGMYVTVLSGRYCQIGCYKFQLHPLGE